MYPDPNDGRHPPYNPHASAPPPAAPQAATGYYYPVQHPQAPGAAVQVPPPQPYYSAGPPPPMMPGHPPPPGATHAYTVPPQQYGGMPPPPPVVGQQPVYYAPPHPAQPAKVQPMETYAAPPSGGGPPQQGAAGVEEAGQGGKPKYQDVWAAVLFLLHIGVIVYIALAPGLKALRSDELTKSTGANAAAPGSPPDSNGQPSLSSGDMAAEYLGVAIVLGAAACWCGLWLTVLLKNAGNMIKAAFFGSMASSAIGIAAALLMGNIVLAGVCLLGLLINGMYYYCVRNRIPFAAANLKCAATAVLQHKSLLALAGLMALVQIGWVMLWQLAALGVVFTKGEQMVVIDGHSYKMAECASDTATTSCFCTEVASGLRGGTQAGLCEDVAVFQTSVSPVAVFLLLISMFWGSLVAKNVLFCTVAGVVADWWYNGVNAAQGAVRRSFLRATTTSLGSIAFGSLILAVLRATREMVKAGDRDDRRGNNAARAIVQCLLACIDRLMEIFNRYTMVYCAVFGHSFIASGRKAFDMFKASGLSAIINDDLAETALNLVAFVVALLTAVVGYIYGVLFLGASSDWPIVLGVVGFFAGLFLALLAMSVIDAGVATVYVLISEDPDAFMRTNPALFVELNNAWAAIGYNSQSKQYMRP